MDVLLADEATYDKASSLEVALGLIGLSRFDDAVGRLRKAAFRGLRMLVKELKLPLQRLR